MWCSTSKRCNHFKGSSFQLITSEVRNFLLCFLWHFVFNGHELLALFIFSEVFFLSHKGEIFSICVCLYALFIKLWLTNIVPYWQATLNEGHTALQGRKWNGTAVSCPQQGSELTQELVVKSEVLRLTPNWSATGQVTLTSEGRRKSVEKQRWKQHHQLCCL